MFPAPRPRVTALSAALVGLVAALAACTGEPVAEEEPPPPPPTLADLDTTTMTVPRAAFCDEVDDAAVEAALDGEAAGTAHYDNGDVVALEGGGEDRLHEFGCRWYGADGADDPTAPRAAAWVLVPPVTPETAQAYASAAADTEGCEPLPATDADGTDAEAGPAGFGDPTAALRCTRTIAADDGTETTQVEVSHRGLFGDAWLTCTLAAPSAGQQADDPDALSALEERADAWCAAVAVAAAD
ncbi:hypothetical protein RDV89_00720 [Nocardioides zeae]|uniref:DUF3558 domain-containing protein n=1 Tax=Nocardioides imazamoxiresistens TaxID=3231893 RepID=A0ABU3PQT9_9ACTN|nr:hypothetical protein [Nocardioides zeae]MDT9591568.1 hypothetical protein [Nocardioides zeae]